MRAPLEWLHQYCDPGLSAREVEERLTMTGTKVEAVHHHGVGALEHFVVGKVLEHARHPDADRLSVCKVDVGDGHVAQIVCGAPNVAGGQTVAVARPGAVMPGGTTLGAAKLRGVTSEGMILAEDELAIGVEHAGIMVLDELLENGARLHPGTPLEHVLPIATEVLELEITPNRPDCLGIYGVARELHAATGAPLAPPPWAEDRGTPRVLMEVANWVGPNIHRTSQVLGLRSEASGRFEKGLAPEQAMDAQALAARLMTALIGATLVPGTIDVGGPGPPPATIRLRTDRVTAILGMPIGRERQAEIL